MIYGTKTEHHESLGELMSNYWTVLIAYFGGSKTMTFPREGQEKEESGHARKRGVRPRPDNISQAEPTKKRRAQPQELSRHPDDDVHDTVCKRTTATEQVMHHDESDEKLETQATKQSAQPSFPTLDDPSAKKLVTLSEPVHPKRAFGTT